MLKTRFCAEFGIDHPIVQGDLSDIASDATYGVVRERRRSGAT